MGFAYGGEGGRGEARGRGRGDSDLEEEIFHGERGKTGVGKKIEICMDVHFSIYITEKYMFLLGLNFCFFT